MMNGGLPLIRANVAALNDETTSASHWYGYFENGASSLSARCTMQGRFYVFAKCNQKNLPTKFTMHYDVRTFVTALRQLLLTHF
jgi:hypothetical protein